MNLAGQKVLRFRFSEKMDRRGANSWLRFFPDQEIKKTVWHGAVEAEVVLFEALPADTVIVVELMPGTTDSHRVTSNEARRFPIATGDSLYGGAISGRLVIADSAMAGAVVELFAVPPDTVEYFQQKPLRRTESDSLGVFRFDWLPVPGGPWLLRAFADADHNLRTGDKDAQRLSPDTLSISPAAPAIDTGILTVFDWNHPGTLRTGAFDASRWPGGVAAWALSVTDADTGWTPRPAKRGMDSVGWLDPLTGGVVEEAPPHLVRLVVFVDVDGDSTFSAIPDTLYGPPAVTGTDSTVHSTADSTTWFLEPWGLVEGIDLEPGMTADFTVPALGDSLVPWAAPVVADTLAAVAADSLTAAAGDRSHSDVDPLEQE